MKEIDEIIKALRIFEELGLVIKDIYASKEFINKARKNREEIDKVGISLKLLEMDTTFDCWVDKKKFRKRNKGKKGVEGMMFGINFRRIN